MAQRSFTHRKRAKIAPSDDRGLSAADVDSLAEELEQLRLFRASLLQPVAVSGTYNVHDRSEKLRLAKRLWIGDYSHGA